MIMKHLLDENAYKKPDSCINDKIQSNLLAFVRRYKMCFIESEWKFLNDKHYEVSNFYELPKIHKSIIIESARNNHKNEIIEMFEPNDFKLRPIVCGPKCLTKN